MNKKVLFFLILVISALLSFSLCQAATKIQSTPLKGISGLKKAIQIQRETKKPIILWSTWDTCSNCSKVSKWFAGSEVKRKLKKFPRVILSSKGKKDEMIESEKMGFTGGNFYIIYDYNAKSYNSVWAWKQGTYKIKKDLLKQLKSEVR